MDVYLQQSETFFANPTIRRTLNSETGNFQHLSRHWILVEFFRRHATTDRRHVQFVQLRAAERDRRNLFRRNFQLSQQLRGGAAHVQYLWEVRGFCCCRF